MKPNLDSLKTEIEDYLKAEGFLVFHGHPRLGEPTAMVHWDSQRYPDFRLFLEVAKQLDTKLIVFYHRELPPEFLDDLLEQLEEADLPEDDFVELGRRLREMRAFEGSTCVLELSFESQGGVYVYTKATEWYDEILEIADELDEYTADEEDEDDDEPEDEMGRYFSRN